MEKKPTITDFPNMPDFPEVPNFAKMIRQACEVIGNIRGIPYDFNGTLSLDNKFTVLFKIVKDMFDAQETLANSYKELYDFVKNYLANLDTTGIDKLIQKYLATMIFVQISDAGYIVYTIPDSWSTIQFGTSGLDTITPDYIDYGHLVISY